MMFRRPVVVRRGPGLLGAVARTAVVAGTAAVTVGAIQGHQQRKATEAQAGAQEAAAEQQQAAQSQQDIAGLQQQMAAMQAEQAAAATQQVAPAAAPAGGDMMAQLQQLAQMKQSGVLTDEEFAAAKAKLLGT
ncbi:MAG: SHOCT domain-containing protein [Dehalococcoidia bacterium]